LFQQFLRRSHNFTLHRLIAFPFCLPGNVVVGTSTMRTRNVNITDQLEQRGLEDKTRFELMRAAVKEGFDAIDRGDYAALNSERDIGAFLREIHEEVSGQKF
jgi:hypothetical protein